ncbi:hypothetical protein D7D52_09000 [Nocardia yunnanensis]|uniref:FAD-binding domain-containing protein n=1 Tax=Nocardia yunnanensis TaxID=2382165 RepID=A0A386ZMM2_9NOCA|nr:hypothetical protein D7D52_09000 [Nocardia yunnanensis]
MRTPVLVIGGGPVGLTLSILLSRSGIDHVVLEARTAPSPHPKARGISARSTQPRTGVFPGRIGAGAVRACGRSGSPRRATDLVRPGRRRGDGDGPRGAFGQIVDPACGLAERLRWCAQRGARGERHRHDGSDRVERIPQCPFRSAAGGGGGGSGERLILPDRWGRVSRGRQRPAVDLPAALARTRSRRHRPDQPDSPWQRHCRSARRHSRYRHLAHGRAAGRLLVEAGRRRHRGGPRDPARHLRIRAP